MIIALGFIAYVLYAIVRLARNFDQPISRFSRHEADALPAPGVVICPATLQGFELVPVQSSAAPNVVDLSSRDTCGFFDSRQRALNVSGSGLRPCAYEFVDFRFLDLVQDVNRCLMVKPGMVFRSIRDIIEITYWYKAPSDATVDFDQVYYGLFTEGEMDQAKVQVSIGSGRAALALQASEEKKLGEKTYAREWEVTTSASLPATEFGTVRCAEWPDLCRPEDANHTFTYSGLTIFLSSMVVNRRTEQLAFSPLDFVASIGGALSAAALVSSLIIGSGEHNPYGFIHMCCFRYVYIRRKGKMWNSEGKTGRSELASMRSEHVTSSASNLHEEG